MPRKSFLVLVCLVLLAAVLAACAGGGTETEIDESAGAAGEGLFQTDIIGSQPGCKTCHSLEPDKTIVGPSLAGIATRAGERVPGLSAEEYIRQSILHPDEYLVEGFPPGTMPQVWGEVLSEDQVDQLIAYLMTLK